MPSSESTRVFSSSVAGILAIEDAFHERTIELGQQAEGHRGISTRQNY